MGSGIFKSAPTEPPARRTKAFGAFEQPGTKGRRGSGNAAAMAMDTGTRNVVIGDATEDVDHDVTLNDIPKDEESTKIIMDSLKSHFLFKEMSPKDLMRVVNEMEERPVPGSTKLINQGEEGDTFYIVKSGVFDVFVDNTLVVSLEAGASFGELSLMYNAPRAATVAASEDAVVFTMGRKHFKFLLTEATKNQAAQRRQFLKDVPLLKNLSDHKLEMLADCFTSEEYKDGEVIIKQGDEGKMLFIVEDGNVLVEKDEKVVADLSVGAFFGEQALLKDQPRGATIRAKGTVRCLKLPRSEIESMYGNMADFLREAENETKQESKDNRQSVEMKMEDIRAENLEVLGVIGKGGFGLVKLVKTKGKRPQALVLKCLQKTQLLKMGQKSNIVREKQIMQALNHPHILRLKGTFSDTNRLYFVLPFLQGGDAMVAMTAKGGSFSIGTTRVYAACVTDAFEVMHKKNIIYRDLKPENLAFDRKGVIQLLDMGLAKRTERRTFTVCGTPEYMCPEIINGRGHHKSVDYWTLGVLIHEMILGKTPFYAPNSSQLQIYKRVNTFKKLHFPPVLTSKGSDAKAVIKLIRKLMIKKVTRRLGCLRRGVGDIKNMAWFKLIDWNKVRSGKLKMPIKPVCGDKFDMRNFLDWGEQQPVEIYTQTNEPFEQIWDENFPPCGMAEFDSGKEEVETKDEEPLPEPTLREILTKMSEMHENMVARLNRLEEADFSTKEKLEEMVAERMADAAALAAGAYPDGPASKSGAI